MRQTFSTIFAVSLAGFFTALMPMHAAAQIIIETTTTSGTVPGTAITYTVTDSGGTPRNVFPGNHTFTSGTVFKSINGFPEFVDTNGNGAVQTLTVTFSAPIPISDVVLGTSSFNNGTATVTVSGGTATAADFNLSDGLNPSFGGNTSGTATYTPATGVIAAAAGDHGIILGSNSANTLTGFTIVSNPSADAYTFFFGLVAVPPSIAKAFGAAVIPPNGTTSLTLTVTAAEVLAGVSFTDTLPAGLVVSTPNALVNTCAGGTVTATAGSGAVSATGLTFAAAGTCTITVNVTATAAGILTNSVTVSDTDAGTGNTANAQLSTVLPLTFSKAFGAPTIDINGATTLTFTVTNPNPIPLTALAFTDTLPAGLVVSTPNGLVTTCGGTIAAVPAMNLITVTGGTVAASVSCTITVSVVGIVDGLQTNVTSGVTTAEGSSGTPATAALTILPIIDGPGVYQLRYLSNLNQGDSYINLSNAGSLNGFDPAGRLCVNVYTFDPAEELISCCACPVTPNGLNSLSARNDLISNTLTPGVPTSITVKLISSLPLAGVCNATSPAAASVVRGMRAWATTLHLNTAVTPAAYQDTETPFTNGELSVSELSKLTSFCAFIQANGSGFGICKSCRAGALGAEQK